MKYEKEYQEVFYNDTQIFLGFLIFIYKKNYEQRNETTNREI